MRLENESTGTNIAVFGNDAFDKAPLCIREKTSISALHLITRRGVSPVQGGINRAIPPSLRQLWEQETAGLGQV